MSVDRSVRKIRRIVPKDDVTLLEHYGDLITIQPASVMIIEDERGVYRFAQNQLYCWLLENGEVDLNSMCIAYQMGHFTLEEYMEFYRGIGYSLSGFEEIFGDVLWPEKEGEQGENE